MCYILYGAVNREIDASDLERITKSSDFTFRKGTKHEEMMGFLGMGNNPMVGATVSVAVAVEESLK